MDEKPPVNNLSGKDVGDFAKSVGKDTAKQAIVWTLASLLTKGIRNVAGYYQSNPRQGPRQ